MAFVDTLRTIKTTVIGKKLITYNLLNVSSDANGQTYTTNIYVPDITVVNSLSTKVLQVHSSGSSCDVRLYFNQPPTPALCLAFDPSNALVFDYGRFGGIPHTNGDNGEGDLYVYIEGLGNTEKISILLKTQSTLL